MLLDICMFASGIKKLRKLSKFFNLIIIYLYFHYFALSSQSTALSGVTQHARSPEFGGKWGTECLNTRFPLPTQLCEDDLI